VCVNGLELTLCVNVNPIMKLIYTLCKCKCKSKFIYIVLRGSIKQGKYKNIHPQLIHMTFARRSGHQRYIIKLYVK